MNAVGIAGPGKLSQNERGRVQRSCQRGWARVCSLVRRHWIFTIALSVAAVLRAAALIGFQPALLIRLDSYDYLWGAVHLSPNLVNTSGYSLFLWLLRPFGSLALVAAIQHLLGLGIAVMVYAVLRRYRLPAWGATLAAAPILFDPTQLVVEQYILPDMLNTFLAIAALAMLLLVTTPTWWRPAAAGLLIGISAITRPTTVPLIILIPLYLLIRRAGWRRASVALLTGALPVTGYMGWFLAVQGSFSLSNSAGLFLWSNTMSFANCTVIKPPADLRALCPSAQPGAFAQVTQPQRITPAGALWDHQAWQWQQQQSANHGSAPDTSAFNPATNNKALRFAIKAIEAQPAAYARLVAREMIKPFSLSRPPLGFPTFDPSSATMPGADHRYAVDAIRAYTGNGQHVAAHLGSSSGTSVHQPYASFIRRYQKIVSLPGPVLALIVLTGFAGLLLPRRRSAAAALVWVSGITVLILPIATHSYAYRFVIPALPLFGIAAALTLRPMSTATQPLSPHEPGESQQAEQRPADS